MSELIVTEIFHSIQGESSHAGLPCWFIRLTGCPLRCSWCDTVYGFAGGSPYSIKSVLEKLKSSSTKLVEVTGGEPLAQEASIPLMKTLIEEGYKVLIETGGSEDISKVPKEVSIIMDIKCPGSKMHAKNLWANLDHLKASDEIKFVIASRKDFEWASQLVKERQLHTLCTVLMSPAWGLVSPKDLSAWILDSDMSSLVRLNLQLHKFIWGPRAKGV